MTDVIDNEWQSFSSAQDELLVAGLALDWSNSEVAELAAVTEKVVAMRVNDAEFKRKVADRRVTHAQTAGLMTARQAPLMEGTKQLLSLAGDMRLAAARVVLDWALRFLRGEELTVWVADLRPFLARNPHGHCPSRPIT